MKLFVKMQEKEHQWPLSLQCWLSYSRKYFSGNESLSKTRGMKDGLRGPRISRKTGESTSLCGSKGFLPAKMQTFGLFINTHMTFLATEGMWVLGK